MEKPIRRPPPRPSRGDIPLQRRPAGSPFKPAEPPAPHQADILSDDTGVIDLRGTSDWKSLKTIQCGDYSHGQILITCEALASPSDVHSADLPRWPHVEVRLVARVRNQRFVLLEAALGSHSTTSTGGPTASAGPVFMPFGPGEVPDSVEVLGRARRGGLPESSFDADEKLNLTASWRFHL
jgi:hypothetical protein